MEFVKFQVFYQMFVFRCVLGAGRSLLISQGKISKHSRSYVSCWLDRTTHVQLGWEFLLQDVTL